GRCPAIPCLPSAKSMYSGRSRAPVIRSQLSLMQKGSIRTQCGGSPARIGYLPVGAAEPSTRSRHKVATLSATRPYGVGEVARCVSIWDSYPLTEVRSVQLASAPQRAGFGARCDSGRHLGRCDDASLAEPRDHLR